MEATLWPLLSHALGVNRAQPGFGAKQNAGETTGIDPQTTKTVLPHAHTHAATWTRKCAGKGIGDQNKHALLTRTAAPEAPFKGGRAQPGFELAVVPSMLVCADPKAWEVSSHGSVGGQTTVGRVRRDFVRDGRPSQRAPRQITMDESFGLHRDMSGHCGPRHGPGSRYGYFRYPAGSFQPVSITTRIYVT